MMIMPGKMDRRITLQSATLSTDTYGEEVETWATFKTVWAHYLPGGGNEQYSSKQVFAETEARFFIRWRPDVSPVNRIIFEDREYDILSVTEVGRREGLELKVRARGE